MRRPFPPTVHDALDRELVTAATATTGEDRWHALERAHILSQPWPWPHTVVHWHMLRLALGQRDRREALGQVVRLLVAAPGSASGRDHGGHVPPDTGHMAFTLEVPRTAPGSGNG
ncbi:MAG TPA: DUF3703 domain-containing protein [Acidimicrobiales bacterium]|nr:DUF3703 domain-containing protein [Acidimicrobiales bacterium]